MTLTLDDVRNKRFRMARKSGYEVLEVDEFVDQVEATFEQLLEENQNLTKQVAALKSAATVATAADGAPATAAQSDSSPAAAPTPAAAPAERIVVTTSKDASPAVVRLVELSTEQAERLVAEATAEATRIRDEARAAAEQVESEARSSAERLQAEAQDRAETLDREVETRRVDLFGGLERQREQLSATVHALRAFEATYRSNLTRHLQSQIDVLAAGHEEPADPPAGLAGPAAPTNGAGTVQAGGADDAPRASQDGEQPRPAGSGASSETPRLDALLGEQR